MDTHAHIARQVQCKILPGEKPEAIAKSTEPKLTKPKSVAGRPKKTEPGRSPAAQKPGGKGKNEAKVSATTEGAATT